jgi:hypothetical protein
VQNLKDLEDALVIWIEEVNAKNGTGTIEVTKEQMEVLGQ